MQIDIVGLRNDHWTDIGECKWGTVKSYKGIAEDLGKKIQAYPNTRGATIGRHVFLRKKPGQKASLDGAVIWHDLEDLYGG